MTEGIDIDVVHNGNALSQCSIDLTVTPVEGLDIIVVPVRFCAVEGSPQAEGRSAGEDASGQSLFNMLNNVNARAWLKDALILFRPAPTSRIPVIDSPRLFPGDLLQKKGDYHVGMGEGDAREWVEKCRQAWTARYPEQEGVIVVNVRLLTNTNAVAFAPKPDRSLLPGGDRNQDLCYEPRNLKVPDVTDVDWVFIQDPDCANYNQCGFTVQPTYPALAHELGHVLMLGHGNGLDDDHNGLPAGPTGPKRYDAYCDPAGTRPADDTPVEDPPGVASCDSSSMMNIYGSCNNLQPLQIETARAVAKLVPGAYHNYLINATAKQVQCIRKRGDHYNPRERIEGIGGTKGDGSRWYLSEDDVIRRLEQQLNWEYYTYVGGNPAEVIVATHNGREYLKTTADGYAPNNLLSLPECP